MHAGWNEMKQRIDRGIEQGEPELNVIKLDVIAKRGYNVV
jgi:hypothetical protein